MRRRFRYSIALGRLVELFDSANIGSMAPYVAGDLEAYTSPIDGRVIDGRAARREDLKRNHCRPYEVSERTQMERQRVADDAKLERSVGETVDKWFATNPSRKHELLEQALRSGADAQIVRK